MFFFFKQKTAYEVRISDWSSDVCSSDLRRVPCPAIIRVDWLGDEAKMSPNCALLRLKPIEPVLAMLFEMTDISVWAPLSPERDVKNAMDLSSPGGCGLRRSRGEGRVPALLAPGHLRRQFLGNLLD